METTLPAPSRTGTPGDRPVALDRLDETLVEIRRVLQRPGYRRAVLGDLEADVELGTLRLLRVVQRAPATPTIGEVAEVLVIDPSTASRVVDRAVATGYLERRPCSDDRRRSRLSLTDVGDELLAEVTARRRAVLADATTDLSEDELTTLLGLLERLLDGFDAVEVSP
ncbi:MAG: MarR family winged helix-turn-helix transcriptional regulator [Nitriliruptoraceae bacterium]